MKPDLLVLFIVFCICVAATAQTQPPSTALPPDVAGLPEAIRTLPWQSIDLSTVSPLEYDRALLLMNHALDEIAPVRASEADLMSAYIQAQNLGAEFAKTPQPPSGIQLTYTDATKVAVALLRGPMANSSFASQLADTSEQGLAAYQQMYNSTCQRRWGEVTESTQQTRWMGTFLQRKGKMPDYESWAKLESENRQLKYQLAMEKKKAEEASEARQAAEDRAASAQQARLQQENLQLQQALASAQAQQQQSYQAGQQAANQAAQQQQPQAAPYYTGYGVPAYYGTGAAWCYDSAYANQARAQTEQRLSSYYGTPHPGGYAHPAAGRR
ncbi:MAG TPA: hypothetical protein VK797_27560 [Tepidisphaeraceae bacterium]|jgi:hypothetical protein|nr:hypothetical protein [Tepidisphaeraceae bacterium]